MAKIQESKFKKKNSFRYAGSVYVGNEVLVNTNGQLIPAKVVYVSMLFMQGNSFILYLGTLFYSQ